MQWVEDDFQLPCGVIRLGVSAPESDRKYVMYHGTTWQAAQSILASGFKQSAGGMLGRGVYLSRDLKKASRYPIDRPESDKVVIKVRVKVGKVIAINRQHHPHQKTWHSEGYDTACVPPECGMVKSGLEEDCVWDPKRIQIIGIIKQRPRYSEGSVYGYKDTDSMQYEWDEDDFKPPFGVTRLGKSAPESDKEYVMYHGTTWWAAQAIQTIGFRLSEDRILGRGVYLSRDLKKASRYPIDRPESDKVVIRVRVNVGKVIVIDRQDHPLQKTWHSEGYDTAWVSPECGMVKSGLEEDCVWDPRRIRIIDVIKPQPVLCCSGTGADGNIDTDSMQYEWDEDDFKPPFRVTRLGKSAPESGRKYVMYHGTTRQAAEAIQTIGFQQSADGVLGRGVYLSRDLKKARRYPIDRPESDKVVIRVVVKVGEVIVINHQGHPHQKTWPCFGIDTAWVPPGCKMVEGGLEEMCVWDPRRIRIIDVIKPQPVQRYSEGGAYGYM